MKLISLLLAAFLIMPLAMAVATPTTINPSQINWDKPMTHNIDMGSFDILNFTYVDANVTMAADLHNLTDWVAANDTRDALHEALYGVDAIVKDNLTVWDTTETNVLDVNTTSTFGGDLTMASATDINMSGASVLRGVTGTFTGAVSGTSITGSGTVQGEQLTSTDDFRVYDDATVNDLVVNVTSDFNGDMTADDITLDANKNLTLSGTGIIYGAASITGTTIAGTDITASDDAIITDDLIVDGAARIDEALTVASVTSNGTITGTAITGSGIVRGEHITSTDDATVYDTTTTNILTVNTTSDFNGDMATDDITLDANKNVTLSGTGTISGASSISGTTIAGTDVTASDDAIITDDLVVDGAARIDEASTIASLTVNNTIDVNGATTAENISITQGKRIVLNTAGTQFIEHNESGNYFGIWGNPLAVDGFRWSGTLAPTSGSDIIAVGDASDIDFSLSSGVTKTGSGVVSLNGNTVVTGTKTFLVNGGAAIFGSAVTASSSTINTTLDVNGATTTAAITVDSGSIVTADQYKRRTVTNATNFTITDGGADVYLMGNGTGVNTQTITLPTAAANNGRMITIIVATDPLANTVIIDGENAETVAGAATKTTTDAVGTMYHLICNGVGWVSGATTGTWS